jgi:hypothetical protein
MIDELKSMFRSLFARRVPRSGGGRHFPRTFEPVPTDARMTRPQVFDPPLRHFTAGFRLGEPAFADADLAKRWHAARRVAMEHLLRIVVDSPRSENLVLRGSLVLPAWLGNAARPPGDMDWVVTPKTIHVSDRWTTDLFKDLAARIAARPETNGVTILLENVAADDIWTYDRAPGRRIVFPFRASDLPAGVVQMDFVFCEDLPAEPVLTEIPAADGSVIRARTASKELSLAWKILWLESDTYPQGKDLYDATLLAEQAPVPLALLERTFHLASTQISYRPKINADMPLNWNVDWDNFKLEYPHVEGDLATWKARLSRALAGTLPPGDA